VHQISREVAASFSFELNGKLRTVQGLATNLTLLQYLRNEGLVGSKEGCAEGDCGACSVVIVELSADEKPVYRAINSCLVPLPTLAGRKIITVEGLASEKGELHPVQRVLVEHHGSQCGYCTPGFVMSLFEAYHRRDLRAEWQIDDQLCGNLCRCTGYRPIRDAAVAVLSSRPEQFAQPSAENDFRSPVEYECENQLFLRPTNLPTLLQRVHQFPEGKLIAGGTELGLAITKLFQSFPVLISIEAVSELRRIDCNETQWRIGAAATLTDVWDRLGEEFPPLAEMLRLFGSRQIRNRATLGGNLVTASPIGDSAPVLLSLDAVMVIASLAGERQVPADEFFVSYRKTALQEDEILKEIILPRIDLGPMLGERAADPTSPEADADSGGRFQGFVGQAAIPPRKGSPSSTERKSWCQFYKVSRRREMDISAVASCFRIELDSEQRIKLARLAYGGVAPTPLRAKQVEAALLGKLWNAETVQNVLPLLQFSPISDVRGSAEFRRSLVIELFQKFFEESQSGFQCSRAEREFAQKTESYQFSPPHESAHKHVSGRALYVDDAIPLRERLEVWPVCAPHARARILRRDAARARVLPGVKAVLLAEDIPGLNDTGTVRHDEPLLATNEVFYHGQLVALVVGENQDRCRRAAEALQIEYEPLPAILSVADAISANSFHTEPNYIRRGDAHRAINEAPFRLADAFFLGGQDHFYLETQAAYARPGEDGSIFIESSTQHPSEIQHVVGHLLGVPSNHVVVEALRMGGAFGGKETQGVINAGLAALAAFHTGQPVRVRWNRDQDMMITGKRHPFLANFEVGFNERGQILGVRVKMVSDGGWSLDLSTAVTDRSLFHLDNAYYLPNAEFSGQVAKTNVASNTAFRGFGGPQGMLVIEEIIDRIARRLELRPEVVRERNLYHGSGETNTTPYGQEIRDNRIQRVWRELLASSDFVSRQRTVQDWNRQQTSRKRGLAITPVKFGISFTATQFNQAGALVLIYQDGSVQVNHGGTEMGQGIHTNIQAIAARELGLTADRIRVMSTRTDKVPNTSATAASSGTDLNGAAVRNACREIVERLRPIAVRLLSEKIGQPVGEVSFRENKVFAAPDEKVFLQFAQLTAKAYFERVSLAATGYYRTPGISWDRSLGQGRPFYYYAVGAAVSEVEVDSRTGAFQLRRTDILHDVGASINPGINRGQIEGGFIQGLGWLTVEELVWDEQGSLLTHSPDTYKIPAIGDIPKDFRVAFLTDAEQPGNIYGSKAVGEPPLMLAISVREAIRDAIAAFGSGNEPVRLKSPATGEAIFMAIRDRSGGSQQSAVNIK
jgi:xanthine dehydrogenase molybdopterin binding subunit/xanthine dehydrogenase small subunit